MSEDQLRAAVAAVLRAERNRIDITQAELIERSGLSRSTIVRLEAGKRDIDLAQLSAIASAFGMSLSAIVSEVEMTKIPAGELAALDQLAADAQSDGPYTV